MSATCLELVRTIANIVGIVGRPVVVLIVGNHYSRFLKEREI